MTVSLPLEQMTILDKIAAMEKLWDELCRDPESIRSPDWHENILKSREQAIKEGRSQFASIDSAKKRIREQVK
jgi:putative addiction module component (TIGR02574 family)